MSSIRPLITITIVVAVGVFMFLKINEGPVALPPEAETALEQSAAADIPPLTTATSGAAPAWNDPSQVASERVAAIPTVPPVSLLAENPPASLPQETSVASAPAELPPIPELPPASAPTEMNVAPPLTAIEPIATAPAEITPIPLPASIPVAQYPGDATPITAEPAASAYAVAATPPTTPPTTDAAPPSVATTPQVASDDRYGAVAAEATSTAPMPEAVSQPMPEPVAPATPAFASEWPQIQGALERQELVAAHEMLSRWYGNPTLTPAEAQQVEMVLSQLAGTVVYSTEHRLEPPYTVHAGDTLQTIAQQYDVPWQLLAKINGIPAANMVQPGQQIKVIHGPFSANVELEKSQLTLLLDGRYAGRFPITLVDGATASEGQWVLEQKLVNPTTDTSGVVSASYTPSAVDHVLVLRNESPTAGGATISITSGKPAPSGPTAVAPATIRLSPRDVEEVADILSVGSPVMIRR